MLLTAFAKDAATNVPTSHTAGKNHLVRLETSPHGPVQTFGQTEFRACAAQQARRRLGQQSLTRTIHELQTLLTVKRKHSNVDLRHDRTQQRRRFHCAESLLAQRLAQIVYFKHHLAKRVAGKRAPPANRVVAFTNSSEDV